MPIRKSLLLIFLFTLIIPALIAGIFALSFALKTHSELERSAVLDRSRFITTAYQQQMQSLEALSTDWAQWDDAVLFLDDPMLPSMRSWISAAESFTNQNIDVVSYVRSNYSLVFGAELSPTKDSVVDFTAAPDPELQDIFMKIKPGQEFLDNRRGVFVWRNSPYSFASVPIMDIDHERKGRGFLVIARKIDRSFWQRLVGEIPVEVVSTLITTTPPANGITENNSTISSHTLLETLPGAPKVLVTISSDRGLFHQIAEARALYLLAIALVGSLSMAVTWCLIHFKLTRPIEQLQKDALLIQTTGDFTLRLRSRNQDEIGTVSSSVNSMLTRLSTIHQEVITARQEADKASKAKTSFISKVSHELRTPIFSIQGYLRMLRKSPLDDKAKEHVTLLGDAADGLLSVVNSILDFAELSSSTLRFQATEFEIAEVLHEVALAQMPLLRHKPHISVSVKIALTLPQYITLDERRFTQVVHHLLSNGIKFTERGNVEAIVAPVEGGITISVKDTGVGMSPEQLGQTLEAFEQFEDTSNRHFDGLGLGLTLCRKVLEVFGGKLTLESSVGRGTTATAFIPVELPVLTSTAYGERTVYSFGAETVSQEKNKRTEQHQKLRILVAEDEMANQIILRSMLEDLGHTVLCVDNGLQMAETLERDLESRGSEDSSRSFDLVIADLDMPGCSGTEAIRKLRSLESGRGIANKDRIPVLVVTANGSSGAALEAKDAGSNGFVIKPVAPDQLAQALGAAQSAVKRSVS